MPIDIQGLAPLIQVFDMPTAIRFYRDLLGFEVVGASPKLSDNADDVNWSMLRLNGVTIMLNTAYEPEDRPAVPEPGRFGGHDDTGLYFGCPDVDAAYRYLTERGLALKPPVVTYYGMRQLSLKDPDGYHICLQWEAETADKA
jgi:glyoxylase I family protein